MQCKKILFLCMVKPEKNSPEKASALFHATIKASMKNVSKPKVKKGTKKQK